METNVESKFLPGGDYKIHFRASSSAHLSSYMQFCFLLRDNTLNNNVSVIAG